MKRFITLSMVAMLVLALGSVVAANGNNGDSVEFEVDMELQPFAYVGYVEEEEGENNLFSPDVTGEPGLWISDGNTTKEFALDQWGFLDPSDVVAEYLAEGTLANSDNPGVPRVAKFYVDANTDATVTLGVVDNDWSDWINTPTLFRISSGPSLENHSDYSAYPYSEADWTTDFAYIFNTVYEEDGIPTDSPFAEDFKKHNDLDGKTTFVVDWQKASKGPFEFHISGGMWLPKVGQDQAGDFNVTLEVTVAAAVQE